MIKTTSLLFWFALILTTSVALYNISDRAHALSEQLRDLNNQIEAEQTNIHVLKAEWAYLATPAKVQAASAKHLKLQPTSVKQVAALNELGDILPTRSEAMANAMHAPIASIASLSPMASHGRSYKVAAADKSHVNIRMIIQQVAAVKHATPVEGRIQLADFGTHQ